MRTLVAVFFAVFLSTVSAQACGDGFMSNWTERVYSAEDPEAHARDMFKDWINDNRCKIDHLDTSTLDRGEKIMSWMDGHNFDCGDKVCAYYKVIAAKVAASIRAKIDEWRPVAVVKGCSNPYVGFSVPAPASQSRPDPLVGYTRDGRVLKICHVLTQNGHTVYIGCRE